MTEDQTSTLIKYVNAQNAGIRLVTVGFDIAVLATDPKTEPSRRGTITPEGEIRGSWLSWDDRVLIRNGLDHAGV